MFSTHQMPSFTGNRIMILVTVSAVYTVRDVRIGVNAYGARAPIEAIIMYLFRPVYPMLCKLLTRLRLYLIEYVFFFQSNNKYDFLQCLLKKACSVTHWYCLDFTYKRHFENMVFARDSLGQSIYNIYVGGEIFTITQLNKDTTAHLQIFR